MMHMVAVPRGGKLIPRGSKSTPLPPSPPPKEINPDLEGALYSAYDVADCSDPYLKVSVSLRLSLSKLSKWQTFWRIFYISGSLSLVWTI